MRGYIANTDGDWYEFLRGIPGPEEVNFWQPSGGLAFRAVEGNSPFFFRLKKPHYAIGGYGFFSRHTIAPAWHAWDCFGILNGAPDFPAMLARIERYRRPAVRDPYGGYVIGCLMVAAPVFFPPGDWVAGPRDWAPNIVQGKTYDLTRGEGARILEECRERAIALSIAPAAPPGPGTEGPRYGLPAPVAPRLGQGTFRMAVADAYGRACAITTEHSLPALEAAHIQPYAQGGRHLVSNGLLLRSDLHRLFDAGYITVTPDRTVEVSGRLRDDYENGRSYYPLHGQTIQVPARSEDRPDRALLAWHNERRYRG